MKKDITTLAPETPATIAPAGEANLDWLNPLVEAAVAAQKMCADHEARQAVLRAESQAAPYLEKAKGPVAIAEAVLPTLEAYQGASAPIRAAAAEMGLAIGPHSPVARTDAGGQIKNIREALTQLEAMRHGQSAHLDADLAAILLQVKGAERQLPAYEEALRALVALMQDVALARATHPRPAGPTVEFPARRRSEPVGGPVLDFDVFNLRRE